MLVDWHRTIAKLIALVFLVVPSAVYSDIAKSDVSPFFTTSQIKQILLHGPWPTSIPEDPGNELSGLGWAEQLGATLFSDKDLSGDSTISCSSCHEASKGFTDGESLAVGADKHFRNTQGLLDSGMQHWFGWDGGADSLWAASLRPLLSELEMDGNIQTIATRMRNKTVITKAFSNLSLVGSTLTDEALVVIIAKSIAAYTRTLRSPPTPFDNFRDALVNGDKNAMKTYPAAAQRGLKIFIGDANCQVCHFGPNFSNGEFHDTGRPFFTGVGQVDPGRYSGIKRVKNDRYNLTGSFNGTANIDEIRKTTRVKISQSNFGQWRTPSLRNLVLTAPYMHDGSLQTLRDVVDAYADIDPARLHAQGESILKPLDLSEGDRNDLVQFLQSLSAD